MNLPAPNLSALEQKIGYTFQDAALPEMAVSHSSYVNERKSSPLSSNERLEFLGDAVVELATSAYLYREFPDMTEGELTRLRAAVVCEPSLAKRANLLNLHEDLLVGRGEELMGDKRRDSVLSDFFEAIVGAVYLDGGFAPAEAFILRELTPEIALKRNGAQSIDAKSALQERLQKKGPAAIEYRTIGTTGPEHDKVFSVQVVYGGRVLGRGEGKSKKEAEQNAAAFALKIIRGRET